MTAVADATTQLQRRYISSRFLTSVDEWPPYQPKHYTTLAFIHNKDRCTDAVRFAVTQELVVAGKINLSELHKYSHVNANITKNISDIFLISDGSSIDLHILIEGAPGIGKTILAKEIAYQWAHRQLLTFKKLLLLVFLRECHEKPIGSIEGLVQYVFKTSEMTKWVTKYLSKTEGEDTVIILDGFDELSEENRKESIVVDIINRRILTKCCLVVTSRPTASSNLHGSVDRRVEIVGFTEEDRLDYIQSALENSKLVKDLQHYLRSNPTINALCYIPLNMTILLCLFRDGIDRLPKTQTEMYKKFIEMTIVRFIKKYNNCDTIANITSLPHPYNKLFVELAKLAYKALKIDKIVFTLPEIKESCPNLTMTSSNWNGLGLLKAVKCFSEEICNDQVTFHFLHFSLQEYMAAWHISLQSKSKQIELLQKTFWEHRYYNVWIMYVGITHGSTFALRHFLSGNHFQFYTKIFKISKVSNKFLKHKMKCLHLFQCLVEANKEDVIDSVKQLFQNNQIDLSNQTLLPSDLNTLGFFLIRSINNEWDELNLSNCNIGSTGSSILCDLFLDKDVRYMLTIKMVNFSCNQLNFSSLRQLFGLFNSWHTSEIIITDDAILKNANDIKALEDIVLQSNTLVLALIGSFLILKSIQLNRMLPILFNTTSIRSVYLLNCSWESSDSELLTLLEKQKLSKMHIIGSSLDEAFIKTMILILLNNNDSVNMFVYDPTMPDEIADDISRLIYKDISGVMLIVSKSKIQGIVNTCTLSNELSALELFNLGIYVRYLNTKMCPWKEKLEGNSYNKEIVYTFVDLLYKVDFNWKLQIILRENNTVIIHKVEFKSLIKLIEVTNNSVVYLSSCDVNGHETECDVIYENCLTLYILNSPYCVELLYAELLNKDAVPNEIFLYDNIHYYLINNWIKLLSNYNTLSAILAINNVIVAIHPSSKQIALAMQLQPSPTTWIQLTAVTASVIYHLIDVLTFLYTEWVELDFTCCDIGDIECEILYRNLRLNGSSTVRKLSISLNKLSVAGIFDFVEIIFIWGVQELNINKINDVLYDCLIKNLTNVSKQQNDLFVSVTCNHKVSHIICNKRWEETTAKRNNSVSELYIINCELKSKQIVSCVLEKLCVINGTASETAVIEILKRLLNKKFELSISNIRIIDNDRMMRNLITSKEFYHDIKLNLVLSTEHWLCVCNKTKYQSKFIHQYFMNQMPLDCHGTTVATKLEQVNGDKMYMFENNDLKVVRLCAEVPHATDATNIIAALNNTTSVDTIEINNYGISADNLANILQYKNNLQISNAIASTAVHSVKTLKILSICKNSTTDEAVDHFATVISHNIHLKELNLNGNNLASGTMKIARSLQRISSLTKLYINHNSVTHEIIDDIAAAISCNTKLEEFDISGNNIQSVGAIKIMKALKGICTLRKLGFSNNNITDEAADEIAAAVSCNSKLQDIDLSENHLQTIGMIQIMKSLKRIHMLKKLNLNDNNIGVKAADDTAIAISYASQLNELDVSNNKLQTEGIRKIVQSLQGSQTLTKLCISNNNVTDEAANDIAAAISCNVGLQEFDISYNLLTKSGAIIIAEALEKISTLTKLYINHNQIDDKAALYIGRVIRYNTGLKEVSISGNHFSKNIIMIISHYTDNVTVRNQITK